MRWVTAYDKTLRIEERHVENTPKTTEKFEDSITSRSVHELLFEPHRGSVLPAFPALLAAREVMERLGSGKSVSETFASASRAFIWVDSAGTFYPPAAIGMGISQAHLHVLRPRAADLIWTIIECLRSHSVGMVIAPMMQRITRVDVRRLQLAAEKGGGVGILMRPHLHSAGSDIYAASTRWVVTPAPGERTIQRWNLRLIHGHGRQIGQSFLLEKHRATGQTHFMHSSPALVHHPAISAAS